MYRKLAFPALHLPLVEEPHARCEICYDGSSEMHLNLKFFCGPFFIMVFKEPAKFVLEIRCCLQVKSHRSGLLVKQPVI